MKNIIESSKTFNSFATIDFCYYELNKLIKELNTPKNGLHIMIDIATGFSEYQNKKHIENAIKLLKQIIKEKKKIEANYENDVKTLNKIIELKTT